MAQPPMAELRSPPGLAASSRSVVQFSDVPETVVEDTRDDAAPRYVESEMGNTTSANDNEFDDLDVDHEQQPAVQFDPAPPTPESIVDSTPVDKGTLLTLFGRLHHRMERLEASVHSRHNKSTSFFDASVKSRSRKQSQASEKRGSDARTTSKPVVGFSRGSTFRRHQSVAGGGLTRHTSMASGGLGRHTSIATSRSKFKGRNRSDSVTAASEQAAEVDRAIAEALRNAGTLEFSGTMNTPLHGNGPSDPTTAVIGRRKTVTIVQRLQGDAMEDTTTGNDDDATGNDGDALSLASDENNGDGNPLKAHHVLTGATPAEDVDREAIAPIMAASGSGGQETQMSMSASRGRSPTRKAKRDLPKKSLDQRTRGLEQTSILVTLLDIMMIVTTALASCAPWQPVIIGVESLSGTTMHTLTTLAIASQVAYFVWIASRFIAQQCDGWEIIDLLVDIRRRYFARWFRFDILVAFPIDWIFLGWAPQVFFFCQLRQLLRIPRLFTLVRSANPLVHKRQWVMLLIQLSIIATALHIAAVIFSVLERISYVDGLYWAATTVSSVGYGDIVPGPQEGRRLFTIVIEFMGICIVAGLTGFVAALFTSTDALQERVDEKKQMLASMLQFYDIPWDVQVEVIQMFPAVLEAENQQHFKGLVQDLPNFLVDKIEGYVRAKALAKAIPLFRECPTKDLLEVAARLMHRFHQANEPIIVAGDDGFEMFFLVRGVADVIVSLPNGENLVVATLRSGSFFGEIALVTPNCKRTASIVPVSPSEVLVLSKQNCDELMEKLESVRKVFAHIISEAQARANAAPKK